MTKQDVFYIQAVIMYTNGAFAVYDVVTNAGVSRFIPACGRMLPQLAIDFMLMHDLHRVQLGECTCFYGNEVA